MKTIWIILIVIQCVITYFMIGFGTSLIYSKISYGSWRGWAKEDSFSVVGWVLAWPLVICFLVILSPFMIVEYIIEKFAE